MQIQCTDNDGLEDQLTEGRIYSVVSARGSSVQLEDDRGQVRWYGRTKFIDIACRVCRPLQAA